MQQPHGSARAEVLNKTAPKRSAELVQSFKHGQVRFSASELLQAPSPCQGYGPRYVRSLSERAHPRLDQGRLAQTGLAGNKDHLPGGSGSAFEPGIQLLEFAITADDTRNSRDRLRCSLR